MNIARSYYSRLVLVGFAIEGVFGWVGCAKHDARTEVPPYQALPIMFAAKNNDQIDVEEVTDGQSFPISDACWGSDKAKERMLSLLSKSHTLHSVPSPEQHDFMFKILSQNGKFLDFPEKSLPPTYDYVSKTGEIGEGNHWYYVPTEFRAGMLKVKSALPKRKPI